MLYTDNSNYKFKTRKQKTVSEASHIGEINKDYLLPLKFINTRLCGFVKMYF